MSTFYPYCFSALSSIPPAWSIYFLHDSIAIKKNYSTSSLCISIVYPNILYLSKFIFIYSFYFYKLKYLSLELFNSLSHLFFFSFILFSSLDISEVIVFFVVSILSLYILIFDFCILPTALYYYIYSSLSETFIFC